MSGLSVFLKTNKKERANVKFPASESFVDEKGKPVEWEIRAVKPKEADRIRTICTNVSKGKTVSVDHAKFTLLMAAKATVFPNLDDKDLQDSYGVMGAEALLQELLDVDGEYQAYGKKVMEVSKYDQSDEELVEEAKN